MDWELGVGNELLGDAASLDDVRAEGGLLQVVNLEDTGVFPDSIEGR